MNCKRCKRNKQACEMRDTDICEACFSEVMENEDKNYDIYTSQRGICHDCGRFMRSNWRILSGAAVCAPICKRDIGKIKVTINEKP